MGTGPEPYVELWDWSAFDRLVDVLAVAAPELQQLGLVVLPMLVGGWVLQKLAASRATG